jgi:hypothetical protein
MYCMLLCSLVFNRTAYFATAISYAHEMFMKLTLVVNLINMLRM